MAENATDRPAAGDRKLVIPGIVNTYIGMFKDTSLVAIIGMFDLLGIVRQNFSDDANWASAVTACYGLRLSPVSIFLAVLLRHVALFCVSWNAISTRATNDKNTRDKKWLTPN